MAIERVSGCAHLQGCSVAEGEASFLCPLVLQDGCLAAPWAGRVGGLVFLFLQAGHCLWVSAAGHVVGHNAAAATLLHLAEIPQHSAVFKAKAYEHPVNVQAGLYLRKLWGSLQNLTECRVGVGEFGERVSASPPTPVTRTEAA